MPQYVPKPEYILTEVEKERLISAWNGGCTTLKELIEVTIGEKGHDGRSTQGMAVKKHLAALNLQARPAGVYIKKDSAVKDPKKINVAGLSDKQKEFIALNWEAMEVLDMARVIFNEPEMSAGSENYLRVVEFVGKLQGPKATVKESTGVYRPPKTVKQMLDKVRECITEDLNDDAALTPRFMEGISRLIKYLGTYKFIHEMGLLNTEEERQLLESSFIRFTYNKPDLSEEEIDTFISICGDQINHERMRVEEASLVRESEDSRNNDGKIHMAIVEALGKLRVSMTQNRSRIEKALEKLNGTRADRLKETGIVGATVGDLIQAARSAEKRAMFLAKIEERKGAVEQEIERLSGMDELYFQMFGVTKREAS